MAQIAYFLRWYIAISVIGITAFPIAFRFLPRLADKGAGVAKPLGLLLWAYLYWLLVSLGVLQNDLGGELIAYFVLAGAAALCLRGSTREELWQWVKHNLKLLLRIEAVFLVLFIAWAIVRAANPDITYTEKPMELAFINSILRSPGFPPQDPWLSGYAISYYYFGYVMIAMLTRVTAVISGVAFNLTSAMWFGLVGAAAYAVVYDMLHLWQRRNDKDPENNHKAFKWINIGALLGPLFILIVSNLEGVLEILYARHAFWSSDGTSRFWSWLSIAELDQAPVMPVSWFPNRTSSWLWWRGSRILQDTNLLGGKIEIIDEFPFFSYLLSDLHPHVLAMPFTLLVIAVGLNLFIWGQEEKIFAKPLQTWITRWEFWLSAMILGSMAFLNTWDFPIYVGLICLVAIYLRTHDLGWNGKRVIEFLGMGISLAILGVLSFLPFYVGFKSQAGGFLPSLEFITPGINFWLMFAPLLLPLFIGLGALLFDKKISKEWITGIQFGVVLILGLWLVSFLIGEVLLSFNLWGTNLLNSAVPSISALGSKLEAASQMFVSYVHAGVDAGTLITQANLRRFNTPGTWITLLLLVSAVWAILSGSIKPREDDAAPAKSKGYEFVLILVLLGAGLTLFPEFFYLRDQFGTRMNTIFKFYFEAWVIWGIAAAFASAVLLRNLRGILGGFLRVVWIIMIVGALTYPVIMVMNKTNNFKPIEWTLDGNAYLQRSNPDEVLAVNWLKTQPVGVISEAVGGSYTDYARISTQTGDPTVLGWPGHESQWRGGAAEMGSRQSDIERLYTTNNWEEALSLIREYKIRYIYIGDLERSSYPVDEQKFANVLSPAYKNGSVTIYEIPDSLLGTVP